MPNAPPCSDKRHASKPVEKVRVENQHKTQPCVLYSSFDGYSPSVGSWKAEKGTYAESREKSKQIVGQYYKKDNVNVFEEKIHIWSESGNHKPYEGQEWENAEGFGYFSSGFGKFIGKQ